MIANAHIDKRERREMVGKRVFIFAAHKAGLIDCKGR